MEDDLVKHDDPRINVTGLPLPECVKHDVLMLDPLPDKFWVVSYDGGNDELRVTDPDGITSISPRNDGRSNDGLRAIAERVREDYDHELWFDESTWGLDGLSYNHDMLINFNNDDWEYSTHGSVDDRVNMDALKRDTAKLTVIHTKVGILEQLLHAVSALKLFKDYTYAQWLRDKDDSILSYEYLDNHPLGWSVGRGRMDRPVISTGSGFSRMMGWQEFFYGGSDSGDGDDKIPMLEVEPLPTVHDTRLDHVSDDMNDMIITLARRIDRYYNSDGSERKHPLDDPDHTDGDR
jgi:hypothetical protein